MTPDEILREIAQHANDPEQKRRFRLVKVWRELRKEFPEELGTHTRQQYLDAVALRIAEYAIVDVMSYEAALEVARKLGEAARQNDAETERETDNE